MYWVQKRLLSQNFLIDRKLVKQLIRNSSISTNDLVLEIGPGQGIITEELLGVAKEVIAVELDRKLFEKLELKFGQNSQLKLSQGNFLATPLPTSPYKVFSNIPFSITGYVVRKLLQATNPPTDCYLVVQSEAASKFIYNSGSNTMAATLYYPWWDIHINHRFQRSDFSPNPKVNVVLLHIQPRSFPFISSSQKSLYLDFVAYHFTRDRFAKFAPASQWLKMFKHFTTASDPEKLKPIQGAFAALQQEQRMLQKIHRTRTDHNWKKYRQVVY